MSRGWTNRSDWRCEFSLIQDPRYSKALYFGNRAYLSRPHRCLYGRLLGEWRTSQNTEKATHLYTRRIPLSQCPWSCLSDIFLSTEKYWNDSREPCRMMVIDHGRTLLGWYDSEWISVEYDRIFPGIYIRNSDRDVHVVTLPDDPLGRQWRSTEKGKKSYHLWDSRTHIHGLYTILGNAYREGGFRRRYLDDRREGIRTRTLLRWTDCYIFSHLGRILLHHFWRWWGTNQEGEIHRGEYLYRHPHPPRGL